MQLRGHLTAISLTSLGNTTGLRFCLIRELDSRERSALVIMCVHSQSWGILDQKQSHIATHVCGVRLSFSSSLTRSYSGTDQSYYKFSCLTPPYRYGNQLYNETFSVGSRRVSLPLLVGFPQTTGLGQLRKTDVNFIP